MSGKDCSRKIVIIPVYDQIGTIGKVLSRFVELGVNQICLIVDCPTSTLLREIDIAARGIKIPVHIVKNRRRMGIGYALKKGIKYALSEKYNVIVVMAGNNKDKPEEITRFLKALQAGYEYVQGSRFLLGGRCEKLPILRGTFVRFWPFIWALLTGKRCTDVTNGFRAYKAEILKDPRINIEQGWLNSYGLEYYIHFKALTLGYRFLEVPVSKIYPFRHKGGYSKIRPLKDRWHIVLPPLLLWLKLKR